MPVSSRWSIAICFGIGVGSISPVLGAPAKIPRGMAIVGPGQWELFDPPDAKATRVLVPRFLLDRLPVTNDDFLQFVLLHPEWQRDHVPKLFADAQYLMHWASNIELGARANPKAPVVRISWFAARAYCAARGARLPNEIEWEFAASADSKEPKAKNPDQQQREILAWYAKPTPEILPSVGRLPANHWGIKDLHGLVWEWIEDFNSRVTGDGRRTDEALVCGGSSLMGSDKSNYPAFMRMALRASLKGHYTTMNLGFRCAADLPNDPNNSTEKQ